MFSGNNIYGLSIDKTSADELADKSGAAHCEIAQLIYAVKEGAENVIGAFESGNYQECWRIAKASAPFVYEAWKRCKDFKPARTTQFVENRSNEINIPTTDIKFWTDPITICCIFDSMKKDGYYGR